MIDKGIPGVHLTNILLLLEDNLSKYAPDMVIVMVGINGELDTIPYDTLSYEDVLSSKRTILFLKILEYIS